MTAPHLPPGEEAALAEYLVGTICDRAAGRVESECIRNYPRDVYFIGNLRPREEDTARDPHDPAYLSELRNKLAPVAFGGEFLVRRTSEELGVDIEARFTCYYRVFPTLSQQRQQQSVALDRESENPPDSDAPSNQVEGSDGLTDTRKPVANSRDSDLGETEEGDVDDDAQEEDVSQEPAQSPQDRRHARMQKDSLFIRFKKIPCEVKGRVLFTTTAEGTLNADTGDLQRALDGETARATQHALHDPEHLRTANPSTLRINVPDTALQSQQAYDEFLRSLTSEIVPEWKLEVRAQARRPETPDAGGVAIRVELVNVSPRQAQPDGKENPVIEPFLFDVAAAFRVSGAVFLPFELDLAPRGFRFDRQLWGRGFNCALERNSQAPVLTTTHSPVYRQPRYVTQTEPATPFHVLAKDPVPTLEGVGKAMQAYLDVWNQAEKEYNAPGTAWAEEYRDEFRRDFEHFREEIRRFTSGLKLVATDPDVRLAFQLTNETFRRTGQHPDPSKRKETWRLFQLVFLVSQIPAIWALAHPESPEAADRDLVDIIYFPTGGGKTEAYLGTIVFHCFFDRLRGKTAGVTVWTRFPLRLLTLQQTQRVADVIAIADLVRREQSDARLSSKTVAGFAVGYFVGKESTPNELLNPALYRFAKDEDRANWSVANDAVAREAWKRVTRCPACKTSSVRLDFDVGAVRLIHRCTNERCDLPKGQIPCYVVDNEIYRYLPAVVLGTIDKLAGIGNQRKLAQIFGQVDGRCTIHGYYKGKCPQKDCTDRKNLKVGAPQGLSGPTLFVQDELHLLKEGLGTFDSHYESFVKRLRREFGYKEPLKVIASSATIEAFDRQVQHLYSRLRGEARVFPGPGPRLGESFYAHTLDHPQRLYLAVLPHNKTIFNAILELIELYHREIQGLSSLQSGAASPFGGQLSPGTSGWSALLDKYLTSVTYFLAGRELNSVRTDINGDVNPSLMRDHLRPIDIYELTGDTQSDEVTRVLELLESRAPHLPAAVGVLATSMISHGVDVDRLNAMVFYGMPRQTAEYIQASSRVGRMSVGVVFTVLHPARERDQSHYTYFTKYHEFLGQLVEPVAINRWAKFSIQRTLPGLFMGVLLQVLANRAGGREVDKYYLIDFVKQKLSTGEITHDMFYPILEDAYLTQGGNQQGIDTFRAEIRERVPQFFDQILSAGPEFRFVSQVLIPAPMRSLRDVDESVPIELDTTGTTWAAR